MIIVGELINSSRKLISEAILAQDADYIKKVAKNQAEAGANYIDVNAGTFVGDETQYLKWLVTQVQSVVDVPCCIDSPDPDAITAAVEIHQGTPMVNSISLEKERYDKMMPVLAGSDLKVVALCMSDDGMPETRDQRLAIADKLVNGLLQNKVPVENIYVDPLVQPVSTNNTFGVEFLDAIEGVIAEFPGIHTMCGLSNISFGLPARKFMNQTFMTMAICKGLDGAIINPLDQKMMANIIAAEALSGKDEYCMNYLTAYREGKFSI
jgi:5-methyltetrahydrofolate--homocysteine methyltransferase